MPKTITDQNDKMIVQMIRNWPSDLTLDWNAICIGAQGILGWDNPPTRQALNKKVSIKIAYKAKKAQLKFEKQKLQNIPKPRSTQDAMKKIIRLQEENEALKAELNKMAEIANILIYNATLAGLKKSQLMAPLPKLMPLKKD